MFGEMQKSLKQILENQIEEVSKKLPIEDRVELNRFKQNIFGIIESDKDFLAKQNEINKLNTEFQLKYGAKGNK